MASVEERQMSGDSEKRGNMPRSLRTPGLVSQLSPVEQIAFPSAGSQSGIHPYVVQQSPVNVTQPLPNSQAMANVTRNLALVEKQTDALPPLRSTTTALRQPVVIPRTGKVSRGTMRPPKGRRWVMHLSATIVLLLVAVGTLMTVIPAGTNGESGFNPFQPILNFAVGGNSNPNLLAQQAATVTAVTQDGYESGKGPVSYPGLPTAPPGSSGFDGFTYGQCTYWADYLYHQLSGFWVPWGGNAWEWSYGASASG